jgi:LysM repeat protein
LKIEFRRETGCDMRSRLVATALFALVIGGAAKGAEAPASSCGDSTVVRRGDTLSSIAQRCEVFEGALLGANPGVRGSGDLRVGDTIRVRESEGTAQRVGTRINSLVREANHAIGQLADTAGASVQDLLDRNPYLKARLDRLGRQMGLTEGPAPASVSVAPPSGPAGSPVKIAASGLPKDSPVAIGVGPPGAAYEVLRRERGSAAGTLAAELQVPNWIEPGSALVFVVSDGEHHIEGRSKPFRVTP